MGGVRKQHKRYSKPLRLFDSARIKEEDSIIRKYGLKNKREIWRAEFSISKVRKEAKGMINKSEKEQEDFVNRLKGTGFNVKNIDEVLSLKKEDWLERRLQTIVLKKGLAKSAREARQMITHRHIAVSGNIVSIPSFIVSKNLQDAIEIKKKLKQE